MTADNQIDFWLSQILVSYLENFPISQTAAVKRLILKCSEFVLILLEYSISCGYCSLACDINKTEHIC